MRVDVVDPSAYTPPYDHALCAALARSGADVVLHTSDFSYSPVPPPEGYERREDFYRWAGGPTGSRRRLAAKLVQHVPDMLRLRATTRADVVHFQWLSVQPLDAHLLPRDRPLVLTAHDVVPREPRLGGERVRRAQRRLYDRMDAIVVHSEHGRGRLVDELGVPEERVHVIPHGAFMHLTSRPGERALPPELAGVRGPVVLFFGLLRPYKGLDVLLEAWRGIQGAELWIVGMPRMDIAALRAASPPSVRWMPRFVSDDELPAYFRRADLVVLPYREIDQSGVLFTALAFGSPLLLSAVGGFPEVAQQGAADLVAPADPAALRAALRGLIGDAEARRRLAAGAAAAATGPYAWEAIAARHLDLYARIAS